MRARFSTAELRDLELADPFPFTKGCRTLRIPARDGSWRDAYQFGTLLFDLQADPGQEHPLDAPEIERRMIDLLIELMRANDAPREQFARLGLVAR